MQGKFLHLFIVLQLVEGAAAVCVAVCKKERENHRGKNIVLLMCGGNVYVDVVKNILIQTVGNKN